MKFNRFFFTLSAIILTALAGWTRDDMPSSNTFQDYELYFKRNVNSLNPLEGIYQVTMFAHLPGHSDGVQWKYKVAIDEYEDGKDRLIMSFLGYQNPFDGYKIPQNQIDQNPLIAMPHAALLLLSTPYTYGCCILEPGKSPSSERFQAMGPLFLDPNTYDFKADIEVYSVDFLKALKIPKEVYNVTGDKIDVILSIKGERLNVSPSPAPVSNVGKSLTVIKEEFYDLRCIDNKNNREIYASGNDDDVTQYFTIENNVVVEEALVCGSTDNFAYDFFRQYKSTFSTKYKNSIIRDTGNEIKFVFPYYTLTVTDSRKHEMNLTQILFKLL